MTRWLEVEVGAGDRLRSDACRGNEVGGGDVAEDDDDGDDDDDDDVARE